MAITDFNFEGHYKCVSGNQNYQLIGRFDHVYNYNEDAQYQAEIVMLMPCDADGDIDEDDEIEYLNAPVFDDQYVLVV